MHVEAQVFYRLGVLACWADPARDLVQTCVCVLCRVENHLLLILKLEPSVFSELESCLGRWAALASSREHCLSLWQRSDQQRLDVLGNIQTWDILHISLRYT